MSDLARRRVEIRRQINRREKEKYFAMRRQELLAGEQIQEEGSWLWQVARKSSSQDQLLADVRQGGLLEKLAELNFEEEKASTFLNFLPLVGNLLLDSLRLEQKQEIVSVVIRAYCSKPLRNEMKRPSVDNFDFWHVVGRSVFGLMQQLEWMGEDQAIDVEGICWEWAISIIDVLTQRDGPWNKVDTDQLRSIMTAALQTLRGLTSGKEGCYQFLQQCMRRHSYYFNFMRKCMIHLSSCVEQNSLYPELYSILLWIVSCISQEVNANHFPMFFEDSLMIEQLLTEITLKRNPDWSRKALSIIGNILHDHGDDQGTVADLISKIAQRMPQLFLSQFFFCITDLSTDAHVKKPVLEQIAKDPSLLNLFQGLMQQYYQSVLEGCVRVIENHQVDIATRTALILIVYIGNQYRVKQCKKYLESIGGLGMLWSFMEHLDTFEKHQKFEDDPDTKETFQQIKEIVEVLYHELASEQSI